MNIGEKIRRCAQDEKYTQEYMAAYFGISIPTLNRLYKASETSTDILIKACQLFNKPVSYFIDNTIVDNRTGFKPLDGGKFGNDVEEELRAQIDMLKAQLSETNRNNEFLRKMMERLTDGFEKIAESVGKEAGAEAKCLPLLPDEAPDAIKMRA